MNKLEQKIREDLLKEKMDREIKESKEDRKIILILLIAFIVVTYLLTGLMWVSIIASTILLLAVSIKTTYDNYEFFLIKMKLFDMNPYIMNEYWLKEKQYNKLKQELKK